MPEPIDSGLWLISHPDEIIATFFLPLPDPLGLRTGTLLPTLLPVGPLQMERLAESHLTFENTPLDGQEAGDGGPQEQDGDILVHSENYLANKALLSSSCLVYQVVTDSAVRSGLDAAALVAKLASGDTFDVDALSPLHTLRRAPLPDEMLEAAIEQGVGQVTVIEAAVRLRLVGKLPDPVREPLWSDEATDNIDRYPLSPDLWDYKVHGVAALPEGELRGRLFNALHVVIGDIQSIQRGYQAITGSTLLFGDLGLGDVQRVECAS